MKKVAREIRESGTKAVLPKERYPELSERDREFRERQPKFSKTDPKFSETDPKFREKRSEIQ